MHVCFLTHEYPLPGIKHGGIGSFVKTLGQKLLQHNHRVSVIGAGYAEDRYVNDEGIYVYSIGHSKWPYAGFIHNSWRINAMLRNIHRQYPIDVVESQEAGLAFIQKIRTVKYVIRMHGGHHFFTVAENRPREKWKVFQEKRSFQKADAIAAVSHFVVNESRKYLDISCPVQVIYNPVDLQLFPAADQTKVLPGNLVFIGTICEKKGIRQLVQAMPLIRDAFPDVQLKIAGREWRFPKTGHSYTDYLKTFIDPSVKEQVHFVGAVAHHQIPHMIEEAEVCVFPSHMEAMPIAWIEALAMGRPVVASTAGPGSEVIEHGRTGLLADPHDPKDIAEKIISMLGQKQKAKALGRAARADVLNRFDIDKCIFENIRFYENILHQPKQNSHEILNHHPCPS